MTDNDAVALQVAAEGASNAGHQLGALAALLPTGHPWRADLATFDEFTSYATALRSPTGGGRMPQEPDTDELYEALSRVTALVDEIEDWCRET